jgi:hypothetical protein
MARTSSGKGSSSSTSGRSASGGTGSGKRVTGQEREAAGKGAIKEELLRKKDELLKLKSLDIFLMTNAMGINPKKSDMKPELKAIVKKLKAKNSKTV